VIQASNSRSVLDLLDPVVLEVGNHVYKTTASTLKKIPNTYFSAMLSGQYPLVRQSDGSFFIDRDGKHFGSILSFMRSGYIAKPRDRIERKEVLLEAEYYCLKDAILSSWREDEEEDKRGEDESCIWESHVIFVGSLDDAFPAVTRTLANIQCPNTTEHVWKSIQEDGLTVIFQICHPNTVTDQHSDFSLKNIGVLLDHLQSWNRPNLRFALVYDAELIRELLKISGQKFNNTGLVMYFSKGKLIESAIQWKLKYVAENIWKHYYISMYHGF
jgi:hypothetical protein